MKISHQPKVQAERIAHHTAVKCLREVYQRLTEFETKAESPLNDENDVNYSEKEQEVNK